MKRLLRIARTELLEHRRQPWMIAIWAINYALWCALFVVGFVMIDMVAQSPVTADSMRQQMQALGVQFDTFIGLASSTFGSVTFTNLALFVAITSGTSVLHDRESGTMPFLMLAPVTRFQLLTGKLLGAMAIPLVMHVVFVGLSNLILVRLDTLAPVAFKFGASPSWWVAFLIGAPASGLFVGALGTVISALSRDVRTSMQYTSFFITILGLVFGAVLVDGISKGLLLQLAFASASVIGAVAILFIGAKLISTDATS